jgi:hypothetical protein
MVVTEIKTQSSILKALSQRRTHRLETHNTFSDFSLVIFLFDVFGPTFGVHLGHNYGLTASPFFVVANMMEVNRKLFPTYCSVPPHPRPSEISPYQ